MTLQETKETIVSWIKSCDKEYQLRLCEDAISQFIVNRFKASDEVELAEFELFQAISDQKSLLANKVWFVPTEDEEEKVILPLDNNLN